MHTLAPEFTLPDVRSERVSLTLHDVLETRRALIVFYRGGWCPLCSSQLASLTLRHEDFARRGIALMAISNEAVEKGLELVERYGPPYPLLFDANSDVIEDFGVRIGRRDLLGVIRRKRDYAKPSVFLIEQDGRISWSYVGKDAADRPSIDTILTHAGIQPRLSTPALQPRVLGPLRS